MDGFKPVQRKVIYGALKHNVVRDMKVSTFAQYVSAATEYHHGDSSLIQTVIGLAQDFVGTNNIYMMMPKGAFGTRATGGKDAAAARYIYTHLNKLTSSIFHKDDSALLNYLQEDEKTIEPEWYAPVVPMILINGGEGIGTGWSTYIPPFNPEDVVANIYNLMEGKPMAKMAPWYRGWNGISEPIGTDGTRYRLYGRIEQVGPTTIEITELPPTTWIATIKEHLLAGLGGTEKVKPWIKDMEEQHGATIRFVITLTEEEFKKTKEIGFYERFKLIAPVSLTNLVCFDHRGKIKKYDDPREILQEYFDVRLKMYQDRKDHLMSHLQKIIDKLSYQAKFLNLVITGELKVGNKKKSMLVEELEKLNFPRITKDGDFNFSGIQGKIEILDEDEEGEAVNINPFEQNEDGETGGGNNLVNNSAEEKYGSFDYLLNMKLWSLTYEKYNALNRDINNKQAELETLRNKTNKDLWKEDLEEFVKQYKKFIEYDTDARSNIIPDKATKSGKKKPAKKPAAKKGKKDDPDFKALLIKQEVNEKTLLKDLKSRTKKSSTPTPILKKENDESKELSIGSTGSAGNTTAVTSASNKTKKQSTLPNKIVKTDDVDSVGDEDEPVTVTKKAKVVTKDNTVKPKATKKVVEKKKKAVVEDDEDEVDLSSDSDFEISELPTIKRNTNRRATTAKKPKYTVLSDDSDASASTEDSEEEYIP